MISFLLEAIFPGVSACSLKSGLQQPIYSTTNPPPQDSSCQRLLVPFIAIATILTATYGSVSFLFQYYAENTSFLGIWFPPPADVYCEDHDYRQDALDANNDVNSEAFSTAVCSRSDLFAFQITSGLAFCVMGGYGIYCWHIRKLHRSPSVPQTPAGRCCSYIPEAEFLSLVCFTYQVWDFIISILFIPEHRSPVMMVHHLLAAIASFSGLYSQYLLWHGIFFLGLSEVSSILLIALGMAKYFPPEEGSTFKAMIGVIGPAFAACFLFYRGLMWWYVTYLQFMDSYTLVKSGQAEKLRPGKTWVLYLLMAFNIPMGILQLYWSSLIIIEIKKFLMGENYTSEPNH